MPLSLSLSRDRERRPLHDSATISEPWPTLSANQRRLKCEKTARKHIVEGGPWQGPSEEIVPSRRQEGHKLELVTNERRRQISGFRDEVPSARLSHTEFGLAHLQEILGCLEVILVRDVLPRLGRSNVTSVWGECLMVI